MSSVIEEALLVYVESGANSNKFYRLQLRDDGSIHKLWGRVRTGSELTGQSQVEHGGRARFDRIYADKTKKGYTRVQVAAHASPTGTLTGDRLHQTANVSLAGSSDDKVVTTLVDRLIAANKHNLMSTTGGAITVDTTGQARTALGLITSSAVDDARVLLRKMSPMGPGPRRAELTEQYLRLVPHDIPISAGRGWAAGWLSTATSVAKQEALLDALEASASFAEASATATVDGNSDGVDEDFFRYRVHRLEAGMEDYEMVMARFHDTKQAVHRDAYRLVPKFIYRLEDRAHGTAVEQTLAKLGNVQRLWHGTGAANVLSILQKGLFVPPVQGSGIHIAGRMFGDGVYLSRSATKSLNYSRGHWGGGVGPSTFMLLTRTAMGYEYRPKGTIGWNTFQRPRADKSGKPYNSTNALPDLIPGLMNHEAIVEDPMQISLSWLLEF